jgi:DNA processing protein
MASQDLIDIVALSMVQGVGPSRLSALLERFGTASAARRAPRQDLMATPGLGRKVTDAILAAAHDDAAAEEELAEAEQQGAHVVAVGQPGYPVWLAEVPRAPALLMIQGSIEPEDECAVAIVGSRQCSVYGLEQSGRFARALAAAGVTIVSGGARGVDAAAHKQTLDAGGRTIAVLGCGLSVCYPPEHVGLYADIAASGRGAVISELPMRTPPNAENFPARNRIISGLSRGTLVIEAGRKSGALITARLAAEDHGREVMALPGRITDAASLGALELIKAGAAALVTEPADVLFQIRATTPGWMPAAIPRVSTQQPANGAESPHTPDPGPPPPAADSLRGRILSALAEPMTGEDLLARLPGVEPGSMRRELTMLELSGFVRRSGTLLVPKRAAH